MLDRSAALLGSTRGESGLLVCALTLVAAVLVEIVLFRRPPAGALRELGLGRPQARGLAAAAALCALTLCFYPVYAVVTGARVGLQSDWLWAVPGLFAQGGVAEETAFRGFLFGRLRQGRAFWPAAWLSMAPFTLVHLLLFLTLEWPLALVSTLLAVVLSFPFARLYELGGRTIWAPALAHFVVQGSIKLVVFPEGMLMQAALGWMAVSAVVLWGVFAWPRRR